MNRPILLVEDNAVTRKAGRLALTAEGWSVVEAADGRAALGCVEELEPALILLDFRLPDADGPELLARLRALPNGRTVPVLGVTGAAPEVAPAGFAAVLAKPVEPSRLVEVVRALLASADAPPIDAGRGEARRGKVEEAEAVAASLLAFFERFGDLGQPGVRVGAVLDDLLAGWLDASGAPFGAAFLLRGGRLELHARLGWDSGAAEALAVRLQGSEGLAGVLAGSRAVEWVEGGAQGAIVGATGARALLLVPVEARGRTVGLLVLGAARPASSGHRARLADAVRGPIGLAIALTGTLEELVRSREAFRAVADSTSDGILAVDATGRVAWANQAARGIFGGDPVARAVVDLLPFADGRDARVRGQARGLHGREIPVGVSIGRFEGPPGQELQTFLVRDLSITRTLEELAELANRDVLTGLWNRRRFDEHLALRLDESSRYGARGALLLLDLDGFKAVNDTFGHAAGDAVLSAVGRAIAASTRSSDFAARIGGDEFAVVLPMASITDARKVAEKLLAAVTVPTPWGEARLVVGASAGVAAFPADGNSPAGVFEAADAALYRAKRAGRGRVCAAGGES